MENIKLPEVISGECIKKELRLEVEKYNKICVITGKIALEKMERVFSEVFKNKDVTIVWYGGECSEENIKNCVEEIKDKSIDLVIGVGGGKALDTAKAVADRLLIDIITVPTIAATCAAYSAISIIYTSEGSFQSIYDMKQQVKKVYIDMKVIFESPKKYLLAGIGDTLAKYYEVFLATSGKEINFKSILGKKISELCREMIIDYSEKALEAQELNNEFKNIVNCIIIVTGKVAILIDKGYNGAIAHGVCCGLTVVEEIEKNVLHGNIVAFGILIQLLIEGKLEEYEKLKVMYKKIGLPTEITDMCSIENYEEKFDEMIEATLIAPNVQGLTVEVTKEVLEKFLKIS